MVDDWWENYEGRCWVYEMTGGIRLLVMPKCPECAKFIKCGTVKERFDGRLVFKGFICAVHGEVEPPWEWDEREERR